MSGKKLWTSNDNTLWKKYLSSYSKALALMTERKKKKQLIPLDKWVEDTLGKTIRSRDSPFMEKSELAKLMEWKLTRGKFRPQLPSLIASNSEELVKTASQKAFTNSSQPSVAIKDLCVLRGVGPATASAILRAYDPVKYCFMADESVMSCMPGKVEYTLKYYLKYLECVCEKAEELSGAGVSVGAGVCAGASVGAGVWTAHDVEKCLWSCSLLTMYGDDDLDDVGDATAGVKKSVKRKSEDAVTAAGRDKENKRGRRKEVKT